MTDFKDIVTLTVLTGSFSTIILTVLNAVI